MNFTEITSSARGRAPIIWFGARGVAGPATLMPIALRRGTAQCCTTRQGLQSGGRGVLVAGTEPPDVVELWDWTVGPGDHHASEAHTPGTRELTHVQQGTVTVQVAGQPVTFEVGDAAVFGGDVAHSYANPGAQSARFCLAVFEPGVGPRSQSEVAGD